MEIHSWTGVVLIVTALVVLLSATMQVREREIEKRDARGHFVFVFGMLLAGIGLAFIAPPLGPQVAIVGVAALAVGLLMQERSGRLG